METEKYPNFAPWN